MKKHNFLLDLDRLKWNNNNNNNNYYIAIIIITIS